MSEHHCHARGCKTAVKPEFLCCLKHWRMVPRNVQLEVWRHYRPGQCADKAPSPEWLVAASAALEYIRRVESKDDLR